MRCVTCRRMKQSSLRSNKGNEAGGKKIQKTRRYTAVNGGNKGRKRVVEYTC